MKKSAIILGVVLVAGALGLWFYGRPAYRRHQETRFIEQARRFMAKRDYRNASLSARQTLQVNPGNLEACGIVAEVAEASRSAVALDWRRRIVELAPTIENKIKLASTALHLQGPPCPVAAQTLEELAESAQNIAAYHAVSGELALKLKRVDEAAARFEQASRLEPTNEVHQLNLAVLRLQSTNDTLSASGRATLEGLRSSTNVGTLALRWLVAETINRGDWDGAHRFSKQLLTNFHSLPDDRLQHLTILRQSKNPEFNDFLSAVQTTAITNASEIYGVSSWMIGHGLVEDAMRWLTNCPDKLRFEQPVPMAFVDSYLARKDWPGLEAFLQTQKWSDLEFLRCALLSRAASEQKQNLSAEARWRMATREAGDRLGPNIALLGLAEKWGRKEAREELLWQIVRRFPRERWALRELERLCLAADNTIGLNKVYATMASYDPKNLSARNNLAATSLLLGLNLSKAHEIAKELHLQHPEEAIIASTYAYSLHRQGRTKEGLAVLGRLKPEALETPSVALYYGVLLSAMEETNQANKYLALAQQSKLLPEEKALAEEAARRF
jgi:tetratricopeptide (TPR) repeat protein